MANRLCQSKDAEGGQANPHDLASQHCRTPSGEKRAKPDGRHLDGRPGEEVPSEIKRREERDTESAIGEPVKDTMGRGDHREKCGQRNRSGARPARPARPANKEGCR